MTAFKLSHKQKLNFVFKLFYLNSILSNRGQSYSANILEQVNKLFGIFLSGWFPNFLSN